MRKWSLDLMCPKCGYPTMFPRWKGEEYIRIGYPRMFIQAGFSAYCDRCGYEEEVLPLDAKDENG